VPTIKATLRDLVIVTWAVPRDDVARLLPDGLVPQAADGAGQRALMSIAMMLDRTFSQTYAQVNERTYVVQRDGSDPGAYFFQSLANTWQATVSHLLFHVPLARADTRLVVKGDDYRFTLRRSPIARLRLRPPSTEYGSGLDVKRVKDIAANPKIGYTLDGGVLPACRGMVCRANSLRHPLAGEPRQCLTRDHAMNGITGERGR